MPEDAQEKTGNVMQLVKNLQEESLYGSLQAIDALGKIGEPAIAPLIKLLTSGNQNIRWKSAMALARVGSLSVEPLIEVTSIKDEAIRNPAIWALSEIGSKKAVKPLISIMQQEPSECCRVLTAAALLKLGDPDGINAVYQEFERSGEEFGGLVSEAFRGS
jgi:HEAT repeat protein